MTTNAPDTTTQGTGAFLNTSSTDAAGTDQGGSVPTDVSETESEAVSQTVREHDRLAREIDALSLRQALLDFEMANARVLDLTARLVEANTRVLKLQRELDGFTAAADAQRSELADGNARLQARTDALEASLAQAEATSERRGVELQELRSSTTFRIVRRIGRVVARVRR